MPKAPSAGRFQSRPKLADMQKLFREPLHSWEYSMCMAMLQKDGHVNVDSVKWMWDARIPGWQQTI